MCEVAPSSTSVCEYTFCWMRNKWVSAPLSQKHKAPIQKESNSLRGAHVHTHTQAYTQLGNTC